MGSRMADGCLEGQGTAELAPALPRGLFAPRPRLLLNRDFAWLWWGQVVAQIGDGITRLALLWFVYSVTNSALKTTAIGLLQTLPPVLFGPLIGVYLDRLPKKWIMIGSDLARVVLIGLLPCWIPLDALTIEYLYVLVGLNALAAAVFGPALIASVPFIVVRSQFTAANALLQITSSLGVVVGSALTGVGIAALSSQKVLCVNAVTYLVSAACLLFVRFAPMDAPPAPAGSQIAATIRDLLEGVRFAFVKERTILLLIITAALYTFGMSAFATLFPIVGKNMLGLGPAEVGYLWSILGVGLFLISIGLLWVSDWPLRKRMQAISISCAITGGALITLVGAGNVIQEALLLSVIGMGIGMFTPVEWAALQEIAPQRLIGRLLTLYGAGAMASAVVGMTFFGWILQEFGEASTLFGMGLILFVTALMARTVAARVRPSEVFR